jgi:predicted CXXCH cytochrome family protein
MSGFARGAAAIVVVFLLAVGAEIVLARSKDVSGTDHDVATPGVSPCVSCHLPRDEGADVLWAGDPIGNSAFSGLKPLCYSCHDGTVTAVGSYAFDYSRPMHPGVAGVKGEDCDRCHDPHGTENDRFLRVAGGANFCQSCHPEAGPGDHPINVNAIAEGADPKDGTWDPTHGDFNGTRLWNSEGNAPGNFVKCMTCHATHGGVPGTQFNTMDFESSHESFLPLCLNCHSGL